MIRTYKNKNSNNITAVRWDETEETLNAINLELCTQLSECKAKRCNFPQERTIYIKNIQRTENDEFCTASVAFVRLGDYVILDKTREINPIFSCQEDGFFELLQN
jgi:hypothetical protein